MGGRRGPRWTDRTAFSPIYSFTLTRSCGELVNLVPTFSFALQVKVGLGVLGFSNKILEAKKFTKSLRAVEDYITRSRQSARNGKI